MRKLIGNYAISPVLSAVMSLLVVTSTIGSVIFIGVPYVNGLNKDREQNDVMMKFDDISDVVSGAQSYENGDKKTYELSRDNDNSIEVNEDSDRLVLMYSRDSSYNFSVSGLDRIRDHFNLWINDGKDCNKATISWFDFDNCFLAGTKIMMADGSYKSIEDAKIGDLVKAYDEKNHRTVNSKVTQTFHHTPKEMGEYYLIINNQLRVTPNHRFYSDGSWVYAGDLTVGDNLFNYEQDVYAIFSINKVYDRVSTFDLEIESCHTYFVGIEDDVYVLVHNPTLNSNPYPPSNPTPADRATSVGINTNLQWNGGDPNPTDTVIYRIYFGKVTPVLIATVGPYQATQETITYSGLGTLEYDTDYVWYILARDNSGGMITGPTWTFRTETANIAPWVDRPSPSDGATGVSLSPSLRVTAHDNDPGDTLTVNFYKDSGDLLGTVSNLLSGDPASVVWNGLQFNTVYSWYATISDGHATVQSATWSFRTRVNNPPYVNTPDPANLATGVSVDTELRWVGGDPDGDTVTYKIYFGESSSPPLVQEGYATTNYDPGVLNYETTYYWRVVAYDGYLESPIAPSWRFTTERGVNKPPDAPERPYPSDGANYIYIDVALRVTVRDADSNFLDVSFYNGSSDELIGTATDVRNGETASVTWAGLEYEKTYFWYAIAYDGISYSSQSDTWSFKTISEEFVYIEHDKADTKEDVTPDFIDDRWVVSSSHDIAGTVVIDLFSDNYYGGLYPFGTIWIFDSNALVYNVSNVYNVKSIFLENGGILNSPSDETEDSYVSKGPTFYENQDKTSVTFFVTQMMADPSTALKGDTYFLEMSFKGSAMDRYDMQEESIPIFSMQFYGEHKSAWYDYFDEGYSFSCSDNYPEDGVDTLIYNNNPIRLILGHSFISYSLS